MSLRTLEQIVHFGKSYLGLLESGARKPTAEAAGRIDEALRAGGELAAMVTEPLLGPAELARASETADLLRRVAGADASPGALEGLHRVAFQLCCDYSWRDATELRAEALTWLRQVVHLRRAAGLAQQRDLLSIAGWLGLLIGCVEYDMGMRDAADASRAAALGLGQSSGNAEITAWAWEMAAWFALTQGRYTDAIAAAQAGQEEIGQTHTVAVQLIAQEAKALARVGDARAVRTALDRGLTLLDRFPRPDRPDHHFVVDPDKWDFYAMDAFRLAGNDVEAAGHAHQVILLGTTPDGTERSPMRMAEARLTLGVTAARAGELEQAVHVGLEAFNATRRSLPSLRLVATELDIELRRRYPKEPATQDFRATLRSVMA